MTYKKAREIIQNAINSYIENDIVSNEDEQIRTEIAWQELNKYLPEPKN